MTLTIMDKKYGLGIVVDDPSQVKPISSFFKANCTPGGKKNGDLSARRQN